MKKKIRVGFDFDGVVAYNPLRFIRLPVSILGQMISGKQDKVVTYYPKSKIEQLFWIIIHESSFFPAKGFDQLKKVINNDRYECFLMTSRYACLEKSLYRWLTKYGIDKGFKGYFVNLGNEKPHLFKERMIKKLNLDYYIDDNFGIVEYLVEKGKDKRNGFRTQIHWIYNFLERNNSFQNKHPNLGEFLEEILNDTL